jgi:hypothetical protein
LYKQPNVSEIYDEIKVINQTEKAIPYLEIGGGGKFIIFDLQPKEQVILQTRSQTTKSRSLSWVSCSGKLTNDGKRFNDGANFEVGNKEIPITHYTIIVKEFGVEIESEDFKKLDNRALPNQPSTKEIISEL